MIYQHIYGKWIRGLSAQIVDSDSELVLPSVGGCHMLQVYGGPVGRGKLPLLRGIQQPAWTVARNKILCTFIFLDTLCDERRLFNIWHKSLMFNKQLLDNIFCVAYARCECKSFDLNLACNTIWGIKINKPHGETASYLFRRTFFVVLCQAITHQIHTNHNNNRSKSIICHHHGNTLKMPFDVFDMQFRATIEVSIVYSR